MKRPRTRDSEQAPAGSRHHRLAGGDRAAIEHQDGAGERRVPSATTGPIQQPTRASRVRAWLGATPTRRRLAIALGIYVVCTVVYLCFASQQLLTRHTPYNHFALLADAWLDGQLHLQGEPPSYAHNNDFAKYEGRYYVAFPPFPAVLLLPLAALAGEPTLVLDGQFFMWLAGLGPALLFLALQRLNEVTAGGRRTIEHVALALCFAFGTVYFFTVEQGTVWFAAHVVGVILCAAYLLCALAARHPLLSGICIGLGFLTRAPLLFAVPLFALEALRVCSAERPLDQQQSTLGKASSWLAELDWGRLLRAYAWFSLPIVVCLGVMFWMNAARFGDPFETGYQYLTVAWQARMQKWGLFHYHYLARNLGVVFSMLPWVGDGVPFRINAHGLALWFTTPLYFWLLWPRRTGGVHWALWATVACVAVPTLFYQNTGWAQFGYRFSNDYAVFLFALLSLGARRLGYGFLLAAVWSIAVNGFGAWTFGRKEYRQYYYFDGSQTKFYQPD